MNHEPIHPLQAMINGMNAAWQEERSETQLTLGKLIETLEQLDGDRLVRGMGEPMSYRGYYCDLAFDPDLEPEGMVSVRDLLITARNCMGEVFTGYKGGDYQMGSMTPLWSAFYGCCGERIMGLDTSHDPITLITEPDND